MPAEKRPAGAALHAKIIVVDIRIALVTNANLTSRAIPRRLRKPRPSSSQQVRPGKQARLLALAEEWYDLATLPLKRVSGTANTIGAEVTLSPGTARRVLLAHVRTIQNNQEEAAR